MSKRRATRTRRQRFHAPSFWVGLLLGAGGAGLMVLAPDFLTEQFAELPSITPSQDDLDVVFEFAEILRESEVPVDPAIYGDPQSPPAAPPSEDAAAPPPKPAEPAAPAAAKRATRIYIQAASFRNANDANQLRARLLLQSLPVSTEQVVLDSGTWHRVTVGPVESAAEANQVMHRLRQQNLSAIRVNPG